MSVCTVENTSDLLYCSADCIFSRQRTTPSTFVEWSPYHVTNTAFPFTLTFM